MRFPTWKEVESDPEFQSLDTAKKKDYFGKWSRTAVDRAMQQGLYRDEEFASGFTGWYNQKAKEYGDEEEFADFGQLTQSIRKPKDVGTSIGKELSLIPSALRSAIDQPLEAFGETAEVLGAPAIAQTLKGAVEAPKDYKTAAESFMRPEEGEFQIMGFAPQYIPRAVVEQAGQLAGAVATRAVGGATGGLIGAAAGPAGVAAGAGVGMFAGPAIFEMGQVVGPVARERAKNEGRTEITDEDLAWAWTTAGASGALNAIGAKYLPGGEKLVGGLSKKIAASILGEGLPETGQALAQQVGETIATEKGLTVSPKEAIAEGIIGGAAGGAATAIFSRADKKETDPTKFQQTREAAAKLAEANQAAKDLTENNAPLTARVVQENAAKDFSQIAGEEEVLDEFAPKPTVYEVPAKEEFKTTFAKMSPESIAQTEQGFREELESEDADTRAFAQAGLDALAEFRAETTPPVEKKLPTDVLPTETPGATYGRESELYDVFAGVRRRPLEVTQPTAPTPITVPPVEEVAPAVAAVTQPAAPAAPVTPAAPEEPVAAPAEPITPADAQVINNLRSVAENTANREQISALSAAGLVDIIKGQPVINEDGEALLAQAQAPLPRLTPEERVAEIQAAPAPAAEAPAIVEQEPTIGEKPPTSPMIGAEPTQPAPAEGVVPPNINDPKYKKPDGSIDLDRYDTDEAAWYSRQGGEYTITEESRKLNDERNAIRKEIDTLEKQYARESRKKSMLPPAIKAERLGRISNKITDAESRLSSVDERIAAEPSLAVTPAPETAAAPAVVPEREGAPTTLDIVPQEVINVFSENQLIMERIRKDALEKRGGSLQTYTTTSVRTKGVPKSQIQAITNKVLRQFEESASIAEVEEAVINEVEKIGSIKEKKKSDDAKLQSAIRRTGETYELDVAIQDYKNKLIELERAQKSMLSTPALRQMERVGAKSNLEKSKQSLISIAEKKAPAPAAPAVTTPPAPEAVTPAPAPEGIAVGNRIKLGKSPQTYVVEEVIPQTATERDLGEQYYSVKNERTGEVQVVEKNDVKPVKAKGARKAAADIRETREEVTPAQEENRYTYEQILVAAKKFFGGKAPANLTIVNDSTDPDYRFKAGYNLETGQIILNQAYLSKEDNIADNIAHELGHFVYGDPEVQAAFKEFWNALSPEQQAQADDIIRRHYSEESQSVQMEENQVRAFGTLIAENRIAPKWERFVNAVKAVLNRLIGTKFRLTDRGAQAVLSSAIKRFQSGERIIREMDAGILSERRGVDDVRYAELEARAKAGDKEAEAEAQRMVDEAAKATFNNSIVVEPLQSSKEKLSEKPLLKVFHGTSSNFNIFETGRLGVSDYGFLGVVESPRYGIFFAENQNFAETFAKSKGGNRVIPTYLNIKNPFYIDDAISILQSRRAGDEFTEDFNIANWFAGLTNKWEAFDGDGGKIFTDWLEKNGYDGAFIQEEGIGVEGEEEQNVWVALSPSQIKSADPFTYDDAGNLIPLSQRFQPTTPDIRRMAAEAEPTVEPAAEAPQRKPRPTTIQRLIEATTGVKRRRDLLTINEKTALKDQLKLGAKKRRLDAAQQKEFVKDLTAQLREEAIRGRVKAPQLRAIVNKAMQVRFDNDASILSFLNYANKVIDNANYDKDLSDARNALKSAKRLAKQKNVPVDAKKVLETFLKVDPAKVNDPGEFAAVLNEYMKGYGDITAEDYIVVPNADMYAYFDEIADQVDTVNAQLQSQAFFNEFARQLGREGITEREIQEILDMSEEEFTGMIAQQKADARDKKKVERAEAKEKAINNLAEEAKSALQEYKNPNPTDETERILKEIRNIDLSQIDVGSKKQFVQVANSILVNNTFFGSDKFAAIAKGQMGAVEAANDTQQVKRNKVMLDFLRLGKFRIIKQRSARAMNLEVQSIADTFKNIASKDGAPRLQLQMGMGELAKGQATANKYKTEFTDSLRKNLNLIEKQTGKRVSDPQGATSMGIAAQLIQTAQGETEAEGIQRNLKLILEDLALKERSIDEDVRAEVPFIKQAIDEILSDSVAGILENLKNTHIANYEALMFIKDKALPPYKDIFKEHDELFNNQTDNYDNLNYLPIRYKGIKTELKELDKLDDFWQSGRMSPKQSPNSIKRQKLTALPPGKSLDYNLVRNVINSFSSQIDAAYTNPAWQQIMAFTKSPEAEKAMGGAENLEFVVNRLNRLAASRTKNYAMPSFFERVFDTLANLVRTVGIGLSLGGYGQFFKQYPSQMATTLANIKDKSLVFESMKDLVEGKGKELLKQFSIGERGEMAGGTSWTNQMEGNFGKVRKFYESGTLPSLFDAWGRLNNIWLYALKKSDFHAAASSWLAYYRDYLEQRGISYTNWDNEAELVRNGDRIRNEAGLYAEQMVDMYQGSSDPTKMATLAQRGNSGYENIMKSIFLPFFSFVLQERVRIISDIRDLVYGKDKERNAAARGLTGTIIGMSLFHIIRRFLLPSIYAGGASMIYALLGVDMDEPDEEKQKEEANRIWRQFYGELVSNILVGGFGGAVETGFIDAINQAAYFIETQIESENVLNDKGEVMSIKEYNKERSPFYRYQAFGSESNFGMLDIMPGQIEQLMKRMDEMTNEEFLDTLTPEEKRVIYFAGFSELLYTMRLNDTDVARMIRQMNRDVIEQSKEREKAEKRLQNLYK